MRVKRRLFCVREQNNLYQNKQEACRIPLGWASEQPPRMLKRATSFIASLWIGLGRSVQPERACSADCSALARASTDLCALLFRRPWAGKLPFSQLHCLRRAAEAARPRRPQCSVWEDRHAWQLGQHLREADCFISAWSQTPVSQSETMYCPERVLWSGEVHEHRTHQTTEFADSNSVVAYTVTDGILFPHLFLTQRNDEPRFDEVCLRLHHGRQTQGEK